MKNSGKNGKISVTGSVTIADEGIVKIARRPWNGTGKGLPLNRPAGGGVLLFDTMNDHAAPLVGRVVMVDQPFEQEFEARLVESSTLAFRVAYGVLRQRQDAEDVAQEAFVKAYRSFGRLRDRDRFRAWLVRITWRLALDRQRSDRRRLARDARSGFAEGDFPGSPKPRSGASGRAGAVEELVAQERARHLWAAIDALPEKLRVAIVLANIEGHDVDEVARLLALPVGTVKSRLFLARQKLKERLQWMQTGPATR
jgi:RNA polymerase sigma-70 factor, ECF subfamily